MTYQLPPLPYPYDALEPYIDTKTMEIHHTKHHQTYVDKLNAVMETLPHLQNRSLEEIMRELDHLSIVRADKIIALRNHGGGHLNHTLFWQVMDPASASDASVVAEIIKTFGTLGAFKDQFSKAALNHFGSGWAWLVRDEEGVLKVYSLPNQDSPYLKGHTPILGLDVWEHAYYLKYQNRRAEYIENWWKVVKIV